MRGLLSIQPARSKLLRLTTPFGVTRDAFRRHQRRKREERKTYA
jgi:hypothetical protein